MFQCARFSGRPQILQTKCDWVTISATKKIDHLCILSQNIINEKIYFVLWWWLAVIFAVAAILVLSRLVVLSLGLVRERLIMTHLILDEWNCDKEKSTTAGDLTPDEVCRKVLDKHFLGITQAGHFFTFFFATF